MPDLIEKENIIQHTMQKKQALSTEGISNMPESAKVSQARIEESFDKMINEEKE